MTPQLLRSPAATLNVVKNKERRPMSSFDLIQHGLTAKEINRNLPPSVLYEHAIRYDREATIAENGALVATQERKPAVHRRTNALSRILPLKKRSGGVAQHSARPKVIQISSTACE